MDTNDKATLESVSTTPETSANVTVAVTNEVAVTVNTPAVPLWKKILNIIKTVLVWIVVAFAVGIMIFTLISVNTFDKNDRDLFGYKFFIVRTDSMSKTHFDAGDVIIVKNVDISTLKEGDVITFVSQSSESYGETITHMIKKVTRDADGSVAFVTYGTTTGVEDEALATIIVGQYQTKIPKLGTFFAFLKTTPGYIVCILIPFLILILSQGITCVKLFLQYRREQTAEIEAERAKLDAEREEAQKMMAELMALKAQLAGGAAAQPAAPTVQQPQAQQPATEPVASTAQPAETPEAAVAPVGDAPAEDPSNAVATDLSESVTSSQSPAATAESAENTDR